MLDEIRDHDAHPTREERQWMAIDAVETLFKSLVLAGVALAVGVTASVLLDRPAHTEKAATAQVR